MTNNAKPGKSGNKLLSRFSRLSQHRFFMPVAFIAVFALVAGAIIYKSFAATPVLATLQAEKMTINGPSATVITDSSASGGSAVKMADTGVKLSGTVQLPSDVDTITVLAKASNCRGKGWPEINLSVDGTVVLPKTAINISSWTGYSTSTKLASGSHTVTLSYPSTTTRCLPILYVDAINFSGATITTPAPTISLTANPTSITSGQTAVLNWSSVNATACSASGAWTGQQPTAGSYTTPTLSTTSTYTLSCTGTGGSATANATVTVSTATTGGTTTSATGMWKPTADKPIAFHWVLGGPLDVSDPVQMGLRDFNGNTLPSPDVYDIDGEYNTAATVSYLHGIGKKVICYFDAGVYETYRSDAYKFQALSPQIWGNSDAGWNGSYWLDVRRVNDLAPIMQARVQMCKDKGFDSIEPDEITNWSNNPGFPITYDDQIVYNKAVASWAHAAGLSIGLKGDLEQAHDLVSTFDWTLNEECYQYSECTTINNSGGPGADGKDYPGLQLFVQANKAVWVAEYKNYTASEWTSICTDSDKNHFNTTQFKLGLPNNGGRKPCATSSPGQW